MANVELNQAIEDWLTNLSNTLDGIHKRGNRPIMLALSRKMPRFIEWIKVKYKTYAAKQSWDLILNTELSTELAIPFYFINQKVTQAEFILLDDFVIHGTSLSNIADLLELLTGQKSHVSCIFRHRKAVCPNKVIKNEFDLIKELGQKELDEQIDIISDIVKHYQLPIDMEFPVFEIENNVEDLFVEETLDSKYETNSSSAGFTKSSKRFPVTQSTGNNTDFFKIRYFRNQYNSIFEVYAPSIFSNDELLSQKAEIFSQQSYQDLWDRTTKEIRLFLKGDTTMSNVTLLNTLSTNFLRTLSVWANYLYSLSSYLKKPEITKANTTRAKIRKSDLSLILSPEETEKIYDDLCRIQHNYTYNIDPRDKKLDIPTSFAPQNFVEDLEFRKISASVTSETPAKLLQSIFTYLHYTNEKFDNPLLKYERLFFGESYESLEDVMFPFFIEKEDFESMQEWIDNNIDEGYVIPKYEQVKSKNGIYYWRRFFHAGIRRFQD